MVVGHPFDTIKTLLQTAPSNYYTSSIDCLKRTVNQEGLKGLYKGIGSPLMGQMFLRGCSFFIFAQASQLFSDIRKVGSSDDLISPVFELFLAGGVTGFSIAAIEVSIERLGSYAKCFA